MTANEKIIDTFATRVRQMILQYKEMKKENDDLYAMVDERDRTITTLRAQLAQEQANYASLKMAKMIEISDADADDARKRISKLIRDVNKCITLLSER